MPSSCHLSLPVHPLSPKQAWIYFLSLSTAYSGLFIWNSATCGVLCLASLTEHEVFKVHPCWSLYHYVSAFCSWMIVHYTGVADYWLESMWHVLFIYWLMYILCDVAMNIYVQVFGWIYIFIFLECLPRSRIVGSQGNPVFKFLKKCWTAFRRDCMVLDLHLQHVRVLVALCPCWHLLVSDFLSTGILVGVEPYRNLVSVCISLRMNDLEDFFMCLLAFVISYLEECLFRSLTHLKIRFFFSISKFQRFFMCSRYFYLIQCVIYKYFFPFCGIFFHFIDAVFWNAEVFNFEGVQLIPFFFCCFCVRSENLLLGARSGRCTLCFLPYVFSFDPYM